MLVPKWLGCGFGSSKRECNGKEWQMGWTVSCGLHISYTLWNTDVFCNLPTGGLSSATGARYERCGCWWRLSWCRSGIFFEFQNTRWIEMFQCLTITWSSSPTQQFAHSLQHTGGNTLWIACFFLNNGYHKSLACLLSAQSQTVSFHLEGWLYVVYDFLNIPTAYLCSLLARLYFFMWFISHPSNSSFGQVDRLKMSGQRVTGVVVGGEEVSAKEVQLLSIKSVGLKYHYFWDLMQKIWDGNW